MTRAMYRAHSLLALTAIAGSLAAQNYLPASTSPNTTELNARNNYVFQRTNSRAQCFYDQSEVGSSALLVNSADLRWDGPTAPGGGVGPYSINLTIRVGTTTRGVDQVDAGIDASVTGTMTTMFNGLVNYLPHDPATAGPKPWGAQSNQFFFPATAPVPIAIPAGGCFVFEMQGANGTNNSLANALVDFAQDNASLVAGPVSTSAGAGCPATNGGTAATILTAGQFAPGTGMTLYGSNLGVNNVVLTYFGASTSFAFGSVPLPFLLPGTTCNLLVDPLILALVQSSGAGSITAYQPSSMFAIPKSASLNGIQLYAQHWIVGAPHATNPYGLFFSNYSSIRFGTWLPASPLRAWFNGYHLAAAPPNAAVASFSAQGGYAIRIQ